MSSDRSHSKRRIRKFTPEEDSVLIKLVQKHGESWLKISEIMKRTQRQVRERFNDYLQYQKCRSPWSKEDDNEVIQYVFTFGYNWKAIAQLIDGRSPLSIKSRWKYLERKQNTEKVVSTPNTSPVLSKRPQTPILWDQDMNMDNDSDWTTNNDTI